MTLVVLGHILKLKPFQLHQSHAFHSLYFAVRMVHMPLFSMVSGVCSRSPPTAKRVRALVICIALPAALHAFFVDPVVIQSINFPMRLPENIFTFLRLTTVTRLWDVRTWPWYLDALILW